MQLLASKCGSESEARENDSSGLLVALEVLAFRYRRLSPSKSLRNPPIDLSAI